MFVELYCNVAHSRVICTTQISFLPDFIYCTEGGGGEMVEETDVGISTKLVNKSKAWEKMVGRDRWFDVTRYLRELSGLWVGGGGGG